MSRSRTIWLAAAAAVALGIVVAMFTPVSSGAWPWDDDRDIEVTGSIQCKGFDIDSDVPFYPYARVEGFEIRNEWVNDEGLAQEYTMWVRMGDDPAAGPAERVEITTDDLDRTLRALIDAHVPLTNLRIRPANLEDLFLELTGKELRA